MDELKNVKGIGPKALSLLEKIGIYTIEDLVTHYPFRYEYLRRDNLKDQFIEYLKGILEEQELSI